MPQSFTVTKTNKPQPSYELVPTEHSRQEKKRTWMERLEERDALQPRTFTEARPVVQTTTHHGGGWLLIGRKAHHLSPSKLKKTCRRMKGGDKNQ